MINVLIIGQEAVNLDGNRGDTKHNGRRERPHKTTLSIYILVLCTLFLFKNKVVE